MEKKYVIRKSAFHYSDDHFYFHVHGITVGDVFDDHSTAFKTLLELEKDAYTTIDLGQIEPFSDCSDNVDIQKMIRLKYYLEVELGLQNILTQNEHGRVYAKRDTYLPKDISTEQILKIRTLSGLKFYDLITFQGIPQFFGIWKKKPFYSEEGFLKVMDAICFYNSFIEAFNEAVRYSPYDLRSVEIVGSLEEITDMPIILRSLISSSTSINYDEDEEKLSLNGLSNTEWASLCTLLKEKPFEIKLLGMEDVKNIDHSNYEAM